MLEGRESFINDRMKAWLSIFFMTLCYHLMRTTTYTRALGDYILEFIGLNSWTGDYSGTHLTVVYFGILFLIMIVLVDKYAIKGLNYSKIRVLIIFVLLLKVLSFITDLSVESIKKHSNGLLAIAYDMDTAWVEYEYEDNEYTNFIANLELTNYSDEKKSFHISINNPWFRSSGMGRTEFYTLEGDRANFELEANERKTFKLNLDNYNPISEMKSSQGMGRGVIQEVILTDDKNQEIILDKNNFFGSQLNK